MPVIAGLGLIAFAITLAGQSIVLDYLMGILIVIEGPYYKGDWVQFGAVEGEVEEVGMRRTVIRDGSGTVHSVSNGETRIASNLTRIYARMQVDITVAYDTDIDRATAIIKDVGDAMMIDEAWAGHLLEAPKLLRVDALGDLGMTLRVTGKVRASDRFTAPGELRKRLLVAFEANGIEIPRLSGSGTPRRGGASGPEPQERSDARRRRRARRTCGPRTADAGRWPRPAGRSPAFGWT